MTGGPRHPRRRAGAGRPGQVPARPRRRLPSPSLAEFGGKFVQKWHLENNPWLWDWGWGGCVPPPPPSPPGAEQQCEKS